MFTKIRSSITRLFSPRAATHAVIYFPEDLSREGVKGTYFLAVPLTTQGAALMCMLAVEDEDVTEMDILVNELIKGDVGIKCLSFSAIQASVDDVTFNERVTVLSASASPYTPRGKIVLGGGNVGTTVGSFYIAS